LAMVAIGRGGAGRSAFSCSLDSSAIVSVGGGTEAVSSDH